MTKRSLRGLESVARSLEMKERSKRCTYRRHVRSCRYHSVLTCDDSEPTQKRKLNPVALILSLPPELRNMVYSYFVPRAPMEIRWNGKVQWPHPIVALLCSNPQIRKEATSYMLSKGAFHLLLDRKDVCSTLLRDAELAGLKILLLTILEPPDSLPTAEEVSEFVKPLCGPEMLQDLSIACYYVLKISPERSIRGLGALLEGHGQKVLVRHDGVVWDDLNWTKLWRYVRRNHGYPYR